MKQDIHIIQGLLKRRSELMGDVAHLESQIVEIKGDIGHIDGSLRAFGYTDKEKKIIPRQRPAAGIFRPKELPRLLSAQLRAANQPLTSFDIAKAICKDKGWDIPNDLFLDALAQKIRRVLDKMNIKGMATKEICGNKGYWTYPY